jgi:DNA-damage-inducible protein D
MGGDAMNDLEVFHFDSDKPNFENLGHTNGTRTWWGRDLMAALGYQTFDSFERAINRAIRACTTIGVDVFENFQQMNREIEGKSVRDFKLSRFACYLTAMNGDVKKPEVAKAQAYFATVAEAARQCFQGAENVERVVVRDEVSEREKSLNSVAKTAGVVNYAFFQNAGYRGLYNMDLYQLRKLKRVDPDRSPLDFMGKQELAANLFRITQTEAKITQEKIRGQSALENTAHAVGHKVRQTMIDISGNRPEQLRPANDIKEVRKGLRKTEQEFAKLDVSTPKGSQGP